MLRTGVKHHDPNQPAGTLDLGRTQCELAVPVGKTDAPTRHWEEKQGSSETSRPIPIY